jgi:hypothetical protein
MSSQCSVLLCVRCSLALAGAKLGHTMLTFTLVSALLAPLAHVKSTFRHVSHLV